MNARAIKTGIKTRAKGALMKSCGWYAASGPHSRILTYHSVGIRDHEMNVSPKAFEEQMAWLADNGRTVTLAETVSGLEGIAVTFDDGYRDNLVNAAPVMRRLKVPATVFVVAGRMGGMLDHDRDPLSSTLMTWEEVREWEAAGFEVGGHSLSHVCLSSLGESEQRTEVAGCAERVEAELGHPPAAFAYPYGSTLDYGPRTMALVRESGYVFAVSNRYGVNRPQADPWQLRRIWIDRTDSLATFQAKVQGRLDVLRFLDTSIGIRGRRLLNSVLGL